MFPRNYWEDPDPLGLDQCAHGTPLDESCDECLLDVAAERMDDGADVTPDLVAAVQARDAERRR